MVGVMTVSVFLRTDEGVEWLNDLVVPTLPRVGELVVCWDEKTRSPREECERRTIRVVDIEHDHTRHVVGIFGEVA